MSITLEIEKLVLVIEACACGCKAAILCIYLISKPILENVSKCYVIRLLYIDTW